MLMVSKKGGMYMSSPQECILLCMMITLLYVPCIATVLVNSREWKYRLWAGISRYG